MGCNTLYKVVAQVDRFTTVCFLIVVVVLGGNGNRFVKYTAQITFSPMAV